MKIVVLSGGLSTERNVALTSGAGICRALRRRGHRAVLVDMFLGLENYSGEIENIFDAPDGLCADHSVSSVAPDLEAVRRSRRDQSPSMLGQGVLQVCALADLVFLALHGSCGEDGRIQATLDKGGNLVIPSFAVGRTQEMLYFIREIKERGLVKGHGDFPVYVDSPLAIEATTVFLQCDTQLLDEEMQKTIRSGDNPLVFPGLELAVSQEESKAINEDKTPKVILSASGMCDAGRIRHHLKHNLWRGESCILFVGYQSEGTLGRSLVDGVKKVKLFNEEIQVNATIDVLPGVSGHADKDGLIAWLQAFEQKPELVFVNHGDPEAADAFVDCLKNQLGYQAAAPYSGSRFDLLAGQWERIAEPKAIRKAGPKARTVSKAFERLLAAAERLLAVCKTLEGRPNRVLEGFARDIDKLSDKLEK